MMKPPLEAEKTKQYKSIELKALPSPIARIKRLVQLLQP